MKTGTLLRLQYITLLLFILSGCVYNDLSENFNCETSTLVISLDSKQDATSCKAIDGSMSLTVSGGQPPYVFSLNGGASQTSGQFSNLGSGTHVVIVKDDKNCERSLQVDINAPNSTLNATVTASADSECITNNGSITVTASGGNAPYRYGWASGTFITSNVLSNLKFGQYSVIVKDANDCQKIISVIVPRGNTGISYANVIKPIFDTNCNITGCHGAGTGSRDWTVFNNVKSHAANIKTRTGNRSMPIGDKTLTQDEIDKIACWVDDGANQN